MIQGTLLLASQPPPPLIADGLEQSNTDHGPSRLHVLVVDDEQLITDTLCEILKENGFDATGAYSGPDAISVRAKAPPRHRPHRRADA